MIVNSGGDGVHLNLTSTSVSSLFLNGNMIGGATGNGINLDLNATPIGSVNIANNSIGLINFASQAIGDNLPIILAGFNGNTLAANDDGSTAATDIGFSPNFFGTTYSQLFVNNNGNVTFDQALPTLRSVRHPVEFEHRLSLRSSPMWIPAPATL